MSLIPRQVIHGVQILLYPDGPYVEVAERIRLLYKLSKVLRIQRTETLLVRNRWIYRVTLTLGEQQYIGDAEIHFGAPKETPDGTNPVSCGQTSAIENALTFAGFGDLRLVLERQNLNAEEGRALYPIEPPHGEIEGIRVVWLDEIPYVSVEERLYYLHKLGHSFSMEYCEVTRVNGTWVYRVSIIIDDRRYSADAEVYFVAREIAPEQRFPVSTAQMSAVGNALALAGFGNVRTLLERMGKDADGILCVPSLASAEAVSQAKRQRQMSVEERNERERGATQSMTTQVQSPPLITAQQQETIRDLSSCLGEPEPQAIDDWTFADAEDYIEILRLQIDELLETADEARRAEKTNGRTAVSPQSLEEALANYTEIGELKRAWMRAFGIQGASSAIKRQWEAFKQRHCQGPVGDDAMSRAQYTVLKTAIERQTSMRATQQSRANGHAAK